MAATIQKLPFGDREVIVSVGFFLASDITTLFETSSPEYVEAYDPRQKAFEAYIRVAGKYDNFVAVQAAVSGSDGSAILHDRGTRSTICRLDEPSTKFDRRVRTVSMASILQKVFDAFGRIDKLLVNCEGSEVTITDETPLECLALCDFIYVQFHDFLPSLNLSENDKNRCIKKLEAAFEVSSFKRKYSQYVFRRKR